MNMNSITLMMKLNKKIFYLQKKNDEIYLISCVKL